MTNTSVETPAPHSAPEKRLKFNSFRIGPLVIKIILLSTFNAIMAFLMFTLASQGSWGLVAAAAALTIAIDVIYLNKRMLPAKYITPGLVFLLIFQVFIIIYTFYIAFTNFSTGHILDKDDAIQSLLSQNQERVPDSASYPLTVVDGPNGLGFLVTDPAGDALVGDSETPLAPVDATFEDDKAVATDGYTTLKFADVLQVQDQVFNLVVPVSDDAADGSIRTLDGSSGYQYVSNLLYDESADTLTNGTTGVVYTDQGNGSFESAEGAELLPGWTINIGFENFERAFTDSSIRGPLVSVMIWTFVFAALSMLFTFALGLFMALMFNHPRMRGIKIYRIMMVLPYAFPAFLGAMVWSGMYSTSFGFINNVLLGGANIPWLTDPTLAKVAVLIVNLWLGFPYMFLVTLGALQSIPEEIQEAARTDGASPWQVFRQIKLPLLLVSVAPVLIATFAFNFNNFNVIYLVTGGGPRISDADIPVGHTDILISLVYKVAFTGQQRDYGLASAFSIIIFVVVATVSIISFRRTKTLEDIH
ncbi:ABC transporter permease subunit [Demequina aurantiaca]|uniref:ABC transporter permease subunit n=1 Tax=Demequina aurantiaca TaxID=676200 RepID=UPI0007833AF7|nr:ABC transporter permease subunit [Demequina aurantiaca]